MSILPGLPEPGDRPHHEWRQYVGRLEQEIIHLKNSPEYDRMRYARFVLVEAFELADMLGFVVYPGEESTDPICYIDLRPKK